MKLKHAFTLIELLVVIAIIGLLATISVVALSNARAKARDTKRVADVNQVQTALELFFNDKGRYPATEEFNSGSLYSTSTNGTTTYMAAIPAAATPPDGNCSTSTNPFGYICVYCGDSYTLSFCLGGNTGSLTSGPACATPTGVTNTDCTPAPPAPPFSPDDLLGLKIWLKADAGVHDAGGGAVDLWADQSGNGNDAIQVTAADQPLLADAQLNGKPVVRFDGNNDGLYNTSNFVYDQPNTLFVVWKNTVVSNSYYNIVFDGKNSRNALYTYYNSLYYWAPPGSGIEASYSKPTPFSDFINTSCIYNGANSVLYENGILKINGVDIGTASLDGINIGYHSGVGVFKGDIAEIILYNSALSNTDRQSVENYLNNKYNIY